MKKCASYNPMIERVVRFIAGLFILISLFLGYYANEYWFLFTAFVGVNLLQSSLSRWCLMEDILKAFRVGKKHELKEEC